MKKRERIKPALDLMEEAVHLLRMAPAAVILPYYLGSLPFILALLYFLADMSRSAFADNHAFESSGGIALLFLWMKCWQTVFAWRLKLRVAGHPPENLTLRRFARIFLVQTILQPIGLILIPLSLILPFAWVYVLYQNITLFGDGEVSDAGEVFRRSWKQAKLWPGQNHVLLSFLSLMGIVVFLDIAILLLIIPDLMKALFGYENVFTFSGIAVLNTTFFAVVCGICYLCLDPFAKALYALRCFYGEAVLSGEDLKADLKRLGSQQKSAAKRIAVAILALILLTGSASDSPLFAAQQVSPQKLDETIGKVIRKREYQWRLPREKSQNAAAQGVLEKYLEKMIQTTINILRTIKGWWDRLTKWLRDLWPRPEFPPEPGAPGKSNLRLILILTGIIGVILGIVFWRMRKRRKRPDVAQAAPVAAIPDLTAEDVTADQLPEEGWQTMARELFEQGELRLALRALYLGGLAFLADRDMISIARYKSNRDYLNELRRRAHERRALADVFSENIFLFEKSWYGNHEVTTELFNLFSSNSNRMRALAQE